MAYNLYNHYIYVIYYGLKVVHVDSNSIYKYIMVFKV